MRFRDALGEDEEGQRILRREEARLADREIKAEAPEDALPSRGSREGGVEEQRVRPAGLSPRGLAAPRSHEPAVASDEMRAAGIDDSERVRMPYSEDEVLPGDAPRYRTRGYLRRSREDVERGVPFT